MAEQSRIAAETRDSFGKGAARKLRAVGRIPAVLYGHGSAPRHLSLPGHEVFLLVRKANAVVELEIAGDSQLALVKDVQRDPVRQVIEHLDLLVVNRNERVQVDVPVHVTGESGPGTVAEQETRTVTIETLATAIPENVSVDVTDALEGTHLTAKDIALPSGATLITDPETLIVMITVPAAQPVEELAETPEASAEAAASEDAGE